MLKLFIAMCLVNAQDGNVKSCEIDFKHTYHSYTECNTAVLKHEGEQPKDGYVKIYTCIQPKEEV